MNSTEVLINKTIKDLLKLYPAEKVEAVIALLKSRKREHHISEPSGYFTKALQGDWGSQNIAVEESGDREVDKGAVFRHWYDLGRQLGYCSGQELRDGGTVGMYDGNLGTMDGSIGESLQPSVSTEKNQKESKVVKI